MLLLLPCLLLIDIYSRQDGVNVIRSLATLAEVRNGIEGFSFSSRFPLHCIHSSDRILSENFISGVLGKLIPIFGMNEKKGDGCLFVCLLSLSSDGSQVIDFQDSKIWKSNYELFFKSLSSLSLLILVHLPIGKLLLDLLLISLVAIILLDISWLKEVM